MKTWISIRNTAVALATLGLAMPASVLRADAAPKKSVPVASAKKLPKGQLPDVTLGEGGGTRP